MKIASKSYKNYNFLYKNKIKNKFYKNFQFHHLEFLKLFIFI